MTPWILSLLLGAHDPIWLGPEPGQVHRVVSLAPSATEILCAIDACNLLVGVTRHDERPESVARLPRVGGFNDPDPEAVLALKPDLVLAVPTSGGRNRIDTLARLGVRVLVLPAADLDDLWAAVRAVGSAVGREAAAKSLVASLKRELAAVQNRHVNDPRVRVLLLVGRRPLIAAGPGTFLDSLLHLINGDNVVRRGGPFPVLDLEALVSLDPEVIVDLAFGEAPRPGDLSTRMPGVTARVVALADDALLRPGPRLVTGLEALAEALQSEAP